MKKRLLYIAPQDLHKRTGGSLATLAYYNALLSLYGDCVDMMLPAEYDDGSYKNVIPVRSRSHFEAIISGSLHRYKLAVKNVLSERAQDYEACIVNGGLYAGDMMDMIHDYGIKIMVIHHNFEREYAMGNKDLFTFGGHTSYFVVKNERKAYLKADINCFLTKEDIGLFVRHYGESTAKTYLLGTFEPKDIELPQRNSHPNKVIAITGSMNSVQTMSGITDIHNNYYDVIREMCPDWNLIIAGRDPHQEVYNLQKENPDKIIVIPNPPQMDDVTSQAAIFLCPTNVGGGLKLRLMDGLRMGLPILVHKVSARGYDVFLEKPYFKVYDDRKSFTKGLTDLLTYCSSKHDNSVIQSDYLIFFSFHAGCDRMRKAIEMLKQI